MNITVTAENMNDQGNSSFAYDNVTLYVADCIMNGIIGKNGKSDCIPMMSLALMHKYTYKNISEALIVMIYLYLPVDFGKISEIF